MPTHQSITGSTDEELLQRMVSTHAERYGEAFWAFFAAHVAPHLGAPPLDARASMLDLGCGPGLFLRDLSRRYPTAALYGYDVTEAMIAYGQGLTWTGLRPTFARLDVATQPLPHAAGSVSLVAMSSVLHVFDEPLPVLAEIRRVLAPGGIFLLTDWIRQPLATYLAYRRDVLGETNPRRGFLLFPVQNKYTPADWLWLLQSAGLAVAEHASLRDSHRVFVARAS